MDRREALRLIDQYTARILSTLARWKRRVKKVTRYTPFATQALATDLSDDLAHDAEDFFTVAFLLGLGFTTLPSTGHQIVNRYLALNRGFLSHRLVPYTTHLLARDPLNLSPLDHRVSLYSQPVWALIGEGSGERARSYDLQGVPYSVTWHLDDLVDHCATCPPKARIYPSWNDFLLHCGGPPGSLEADDDCGPGCRCWLEVAPSNVILRSALMSSSPTSPLRYVR